MTAIDRIGSASLTGIGCDRPFDLRCQAAGTIAAIAERIEAPSDRIAPGRPGAG